MRLFVLAAALAFAAPASASTVAYQVFGSEFTTCEDAESGAACTRYVDEWIGRSFDGTITLDLDALGLPHLGARRFRRPSCPMEPEPRASSST